MQEGFTTEIPKQLNALGQKRSYRENDPLAYKTYSPPNTDFLRAF